VVTKEEPNGMKKIVHQLRRVWREDEGVLSFEWVLLITLLTIGIVSGIAAARDAIIDELGDVAQAALAIDQSYQYDGNGDGDYDDPEDWSFTDDVTFYDDCDRDATGLTEQGAVVDDNT